LALVAAGFIAVCLVGRAISQQQPRQPGQQRDPEQMRQRMEEFRQRAAERMREQLGATEDEWKVLQPRIEKVQNLQRQSRGGMMMGFMGRGRRPGGENQPGGQARPAAVAEGEQSDVQKKSTALQSLLDDKASTPAAIKAALDALRQARAKHAQELAAARKELQEVVSINQEARLVLMNILE